LSAAYRTNAYFPFHAGIVARTQPPEAPAAAITTAKSGAMVRVPNRGCEPIANMVHSR
jgi:hypothetical protein